MATSCLKNILVKEGIKHSELATKSGVSSASVGRYANEKRTPSPTTAYKLLNALNNFPTISKKYELKDLFPTIE
ncbi:MAG: helix-turn-helix transcriptional regulator [Tannerella sp.]|jgi:transcriptional regulator with XRE-family HTH domain|nr:helix-turn-helix transcriptional regulator [Tannerella sp.]